MIGPGIFLKKVCENRIFRYGSKGQGSNEVTGGRGHDHFNGSAALYQLPYQEEGFVSGNASCDTQ
jgi:hypothetical protein